MFHSKQQGVILIICLVMLLLLTLIAVSGMQTTTLEEKMAGNKRNRNLAFQAAESALREAEQWIQGADTALNPLKLSNGPFQGADCSNGLCPTTSPAIWEAADFNWNLKGRSYAGVLQAIPQQPRYVIELLEQKVNVDSNRMTALFRITAMAWGSDPNVVVQLQSLYNLKVNAFAY
jgi:type IV pilus assembly protein PilX